MKNRGKIVARKSGAKIMEKERKRTPNGSQNPLKVKKIDKKTRSGKILVFGSPAGFPPAEPGGPLSPVNQPKSQQELR